MQSLHIITPVKDSPDTTRRTVECIMASRLDRPIDYTIFNDFSSEQTTRTLTQLAADKGFRLVNLRDLTDHPSPNYLLVLQIAQQRALEEHARLLIIESDVMVESDTIQRMLDFAEGKPVCGDSPAKKSRQLKAVTTDRPGMIAAVTTDREGDICFPYQYARRSRLASWLRPRPGIVETRKRLSFCCTLLTEEFLQAYDFHQLNPEKNWFDVFISHRSVELGFHNYLMLDNPVLHLPHGSRPWKRLKYTHPLKYYWTKYTKGLDKI